MYCFFAVVKILQLEGGGHTEDKNNSMAILRHVSKLLKHDEILVSPGYPIPYFEDKLHILRYTDKSNRN
jgi:hypothetical protein